MKTSFSLFALIVSILLMASTQAEAKSDRYYDKRVKFLLSEEGYSVNQIHKDGNTALHLAIINKDHLGAMKALIKYGANVNLKNRQGETPLHKAAMSKMTEAASLLLKAGANVHIAQHHDNWQALHFAAGSSSDVIVERLLKAGANVNATTKSTGLFPLHIAVMSGNIKSVKALTNAGASVNAINTKGNITVLAAAARQKTLMDKSINKNRASIVKFLLKSGADIDDISLSWAQENEGDKVAQILLKMKTKNSSNIQNFLIGAGYLKTDIQEVNLETRGDSTQEYIIVNTDSAFCGSAGCQHFIYIEDRNKNIIKVKELLSHDFSISPQSTNGMKNVIFHGKFGKSIWKYEGHAKEVAAVERDNQETPSSEVIEFRKTKYGYYDKIDDTTKVAIKPITRKLPKGVKRFINTFIGLDIDRTKEVRKEGIYTDEEGNFEKAFIKQPHKTNDFCMHNFGFKCYDTPD